MERSPSLSLVHQRLYELQQEQGRDYLSYNEAERALQSRVCFKPGTTKEDVWNRLEDFGLIEKLEEGIRVLETGLENAQRQPSCKGELEDLERGMIKELQNSQNHPQTP